MKDSPAATEAGVAADWLMCGGDMGTQIRAIDWATTPLGPRATWPASLRTVTNLVLATSFPMVILWGPELRFIYNDAYALIAADKHPMAMGRPNREVWPEVWSFNAPIFARVTQQGETVHLEDQCLQINRHGYLEDAFFTLSYSPIYDEGGQVGGILVTLLETTERVLNEQEQLRSERRASVLLDLYVKAAQLSDQALFEFALEQAVLLTDSEIGFMHQVLEDEETVLLTTWNRGALENCRIPDAMHYPISLAGNWVDCVTTKAPVVYNDYAHSPNRKGLPAGHTPVRRFMSIPVLEGSKVRLIFGVGNKQAPYDDADIVQLQLVANELHKILCQRQAELALRASEERFRIALGNSPITLMETDRDLRCTWVYNPANGFSTDQLLGKTDADWHTPDDAAKLQAIKRRALETGQTQREEVTITTDGNLRWYDLYVEPRRNAVGDILGIIGYAAEITERRQIETDLARERALLDAAIEVLPLPIVFLDAERHLLRANAATRQWYRQLGASRRDQVELLDARTRRLLGEEEWPAARALCGETILGQECLLRVRATNIELPCLVYAAPVQMHDQIVAAISVIQDISPLREADRAKDEFLAVLSHELQTPLTSILGWADIALHQGTPGVMQQALEVVMRNAVRQKRLVDEILDMSRLVHRKIQLQLEKTDLWTQASHAVETALPLARERHMRLRLTRQTEPLPVLGDPVRLQQCIGNLLHNSLKFTPNSGTITVTAWREDTQAVLSIHDTGRGISHEALDTLFRVFYQVDRDERAGGLGLGLSVSRGIIEMHGGVITADSPGHDQGSTFTIRLPLAP